MLFPVHIKDIVADYYQLEATFIIIVLVFKYMHNDKTDMNTNTVCKQVLFS